MFDPHKISTNNAIELVLANGGIVDLAIGEAPLEDIIALAFKEQR